MVERLNHFYETQQLSVDLMFKLFDEADILRRQLGHNNVAKSMDGKILACLFYEPSTRTRFSFESAMKRLGGQTISTENAGEFSSAAKGESLEDSIRTVAQYCDGIVLRSKVEGNSQRAAKVSPVPVINAGDGRGQHPTQALLDVYTIQRELGTLNGLKIAMVGDLANGRTVRSLSYLLGKIDGNELIFVAPDHLKMGEDIKEYLNHHGTKFREESDLNKVLKETDVVYMTRIQKERMDAESYEKAKGTYVINQDNFYLLSKQAIIMHPMPRIDELVIPIEIEKTDPRAAYFRQSQNGLFIRMALLNHMIGDAKSS